jgi:hypothetical protein
VTAPERLFARMWAAAALAHLAGNPFYGDVWPRPSAVGLALLAVGGAAVVVLARPGRRTMLVLAAAVPVSAGLEAPVLGNHWLLAAAVSLAYVGTAGRWESFAPAARWTLVIFYAFAAFAKLNTGFLDPDTSCAVFYANQALAAARLPGLAPGGVAPAALIATTVLVEAAIPVLLAIPSTRRAGVLLGVAFHALVSLDLAQHFYDFTAMLLALFALFLSEDAAAAADRLAASAPGRWRVVAWAAIAGFGLAVTFANVTPPVPVSTWFLRRVSFAAWVPYLVFAAWLMLGARAAAHLSWRLEPVTALVVALVFVNGLTPYIEVKTAYGFNMYANLVTSNGRSNHLLVPRTWPVRRDQARPVEILLSSDPGLRRYAALGYLLPWPSFRAYLTAHPEVSVTYRRDGETLTLPRASDRPDLVAPVPWWWRWMPLRAIDSRDPARCQTMFLPAL